MVLRSLVRVLMPTIGVVVEGVFDEAVIPLFVRRFSSGARVITRKCRGTVTGRLAGLLLELHRSHRPEKVLVVADADGAQPSAIISAISSKTAGHYPFAVRPIVIVQSLEAWLLADGEALMRVVGINTSFRQPERIRDPKAEMRRILAKRTAYTPEIARRIAENIDLDLLSRRRPTFLSLRHAVLDP